MDFEPMQPQSIHHIWSTELPSKHHSAKTPPWTKSSALASVASRRRRNTSRLPSEQRPKGAWPRSCFSTSSRATCNATPPKPLRWHKSWWPVGRPAAFPPKFDTKRHKLLICIGRLNFHRYNYFTGSSFSGFQPPTAPTLTPAHR